MGSEEEKMKLEILFNCGEAVYIPECCEHDLDMMVDAIRRQHTFWLRRRRPQVIVINNTAIVVEDVSAVSLVQDPID